MKALLFALLFSSLTYAGDTYDCINSKGDYINYGPPAPPTHLFSDRIVGAIDGRRYERWLPMLSQEDERNLIYLQVRQLRAYALERETIIH